MKYLVELKFTNPAHEHISLRRRVELVTRLVEATSEDQAVLRASQQQRALGFFIKEAKVVKEKSHDKGADETMIAKGKEVMKKAEGNDEKDEEEAEDIEEGNGTASYPLLKKGEKLKPMKLKMGEGFDPEPSDIAAHLVKKYGKGKVTKDHVDAYEKDRDSNTAIDKEAVMKHVEKMSEEVDQIDEEKKVTHEDPLVTVHDKHGVRTHAHLSTANDIHGTKVKHTAVHAGDVKTKSRSGDDLTFKISKHHAKEVKEEVELNEAQKQLKPSYWRAEWRLGTQSDVDKNNKKIFDRLAKTDPVKAAAFHDNLMRMKKKDMKEEVEQVDEQSPAEIKAKYYHDQFDKVKPVKAYDKEGKLVGQYRSMAHAKQMKPGHTYKMKEAVDPDKREAGYKMSPAVKAAQAKSDALSKPEKKHQAGTLGAHKARKAAERMVDAVKSKVNKINMNPSLEPHAHSLKLNK